MTKPIEMREADFKREVDKQPFPEIVRQEFFDYWTEPNKSGTKMKFEMEKTWHTGRRIARWAGNQFEPIKKKGGVVTPIKPEPRKMAENEFERLDDFLAEYAARPADMKFDRFGQWYDFMKENKLLTQFTRGQVESLKEAYNNDNQKCRCACVQITLDGYWKVGWTIKMVMETRKRLSGA